MKLLMEKHKQLFFSTPVSYGKQQKMLRLDIQVEFVSLDYERPLSRTHFIQFVLQNQQQEMLSFEQAHVRRSQKKIDLSSVPSFHLDMIIRSDKTSVCNDKLYFFPQIAGSTKQEIPLHQEQLLQHYFKHKLFQYIEPLEQVFSFEDKTITYWVYIEKTSLLEQVGDIDKYALELKKTVSITEGSANNSQHENDANKADKCSSRLQTQESQNAAEYNDLYLLPCSPKNCGERYLNKMSVDEIVEELEIQSKFNHIFSDKNGVKGFTAEFVKLGEEGLDEQKRQLLVASNNKLKLVMIILLVGFVFFCAGMFKGTKKSGNSRKIKTSFSKEKHSRAQRVSNRRQL